MNRENGVWILRVLLMLWLSFSVKNTDDLYGVRYSMRSFEQCKRVINV